MALSPAWHGVWRGTLLLAPAPPGFPPRVAMELQIAPLPGGPSGALTWKIVYGDEVRPYELHPTGDPNRFLIDEKNGLRLAATLDNEALTSVFDVDGTLLVTRYMLVGKKLRFEVRSYKPGEPQSPTGAKTIAVRSLEEKSVQRATLTKA